MLAMAAHLESTDLHILECNTLILCSYGVKLLLLTHVLTGALQATQGPGVCT